MTKKLCFMTRLLAAVLAVVMLSSAIYLAVEADRESAEISGACRCCRGDLRRVYIYHVQGDSALHRDDRHADACFSQGKAFKLK